MSNNSRPMTLGAVKGQHPLKAQDYIFEDITSVLDIDSIQSIINNKLKNCSELTLYLEQLSPAILQVTKYCFSHNKPLTLVYYDRETGECFPKELLSRNQAQYLYCYFGRDIPKAID